MAQHDEVAMVVVMYEVEMASLEVMMAPATGVEAEMSAATGDEATGSEYRLQQQSAVYAKHTITKEVLQLELNKYTVNHMG